MSETAEFDRDGGCHRCAAIEQENAALRRQVEFYKQRSENFYHAKQQFCKLDAAIACEILANGYSMIAGQFGDGHHLPKGESI